MTNSLENESRRYVGETGTQAFNGMAGFLLGLYYDLRFTRQPDGTVAIELDHVPVVEGRPPLGPLVVKAEEFERWFKK
ncbi:MAG: hypothetical protein ACRYG7_23105 [Janthinobacterium lividum]